MNITYNLLILAITSIISFIAFGNEQLKERLLFYPYLIFHRKKEYERFITHGFIHGDFMHLFFNMFTLYFFGQHVEYYLTKMHGSTGRMLFMLFYLVALVVSSLPSFFRQKNNQYYRSLGASGAVSAILFASILIEPLSKIYLYGAIGIPAFVFGPLYLAYEAYSTKKANDNIGHDAHFTGAIFGLIGIVILVPETFSNFIRQIANLIN